MTSEATHAATVAFFQQHSHFGLPAGDVYFFKQGEIASVSLTGQILLGTSTAVGRARASAAGIHAAPELTVPPRNTHLSLRSMPRLSPGQVAMNPDGNGGVYAALQRSGALADMNRRGVEYVHFYGVDNCLVRVGDPVFVGFTADRQADAAAKVVGKAYPAEPVGVFAIRNGRCEVVEYSEIDPTLAEVGRQARVLLLGQVADSRTHSVWAVVHLYRRATSKDACSTTLATLQTTCSRWRS